MDIITGFIAIVVMLFAYFIPTIVALGKKQVLQVFVVNLFVGWTFFGWVIALFVALTPEDNK